MYERNQTCYFKPRIPIVMISLHLKISLYMFNTTQILTFWIIIIINHSITFIHKTSLHITSQLLSLIYLKTVTENPLLETFCIVIAYLVSLRVIVVIIWITWFYIFKIFLIFTRLIWHFFTTILCYYIFSNTFILVFYRK